jgi:hypothetical protein
MAKNSPNRDPITGQWGYGPGQFTLIMEELGTVKGYTETVKRKNKKNIAVVDVYATDPIQGEADYLGRYKANLRLHERMEEQRYGGGYISVSPDDGDFNLTWKGKAYGRGQFDAFNAITFAPDLI